MPSRCPATPPPPRGAGWARQPRRGEARHNIRKEEPYTMREVDFRYLKSALESLSASSDLVLANGWVKVTLSRQGSPDVSRRGVKYERIAPVAPEGVIVAANYCRLLVVGPNQNAVQEATERGPRPFDDSLLGW